MSRRLVWIGLVGLLGGCTGLNPLYSDAGGAEATDGPIGTTPVGTESVGSVGGSESGGPVTLTSTDTLDPSTTFDSTDASTGDTAVGTTGGETGFGDTGGVTSGGDPFVCSTFDQDCGGGEKCMPYAEGGGESWDALGCFPIDPVPGRPGDGCSVQGSATSGVDDCDEASMCWNVDVRTNTGTCAAFCTGSLDNPTCGAPDQTCFIANEGVIALCLERCDPLLQNCGDNQACLPADDGFVCTPDASEGEPAAGQPCTFFNQCGAGGMCVQASNLIGCASTACCTAFCDLSEGDLCPGPPECVPFFDPGPAPPGYEDVGICGAG